LIHVGGEGDLHLLAWSRAQPISRIDDRQALADQLTVRVEGVYAIAASVGYSGPTTQARAVGHTAPREGASTRPTVAEEPAAHSDRC
jgi:uncharacterized protein YggE